MKVRNPRTGKFDHAIAPLDPAAVRAVAAEARAAQPGWAARSADERAVVLARLADAVEARADAISAALTVDTGRRAISAIEVAGAVSMIRRWATSAPELLAIWAGEARSSAIPGITTRTALHPYPLVGCVSPWNFPLTLALIDAVPALAAGCAVMVKPSEVTPRFTAPLVDAIGVVPELAGVLRLIEGDGATGAALVDAVDFICFTGSVATGRRVAEAAARALIPASLELGGKDPLLVLDDADPEWAATVVLRSSVVNTGQACQSIERLIVAAPLHDRFVDALVTLAETVRLNTPDIGMGELGPFIHGPQAAVVQGQMDAAVAAGAMLRAGGRVEDHGGLWLRPTVLTGVTVDMAIWRDETFGPVLPVMAAADEEEAVRLANDSDYGLSAAVLSSSVARAERVAVRLNAGAVSVNDGALTSMVWDAAKTSWGASGLGPGRMGEGGLSRFLRRQALIRQEGVALPLAAYAEDASRA